MMLVPTGDPYTRSEKPEASGFDRIEMCTLALEELSDELQEKVVLTDLEVRREGPTYAIDTIEQLKPFFPKDDFTLIIGSDVAPGFDKWHRAPALKKLVSILVVCRPGEMAGKSGFPEIEIDAMNISGTQVRELIESGGDPKEFLTESVLTYIKERGLYGSK